MTGRARAIFRDGDKQVFTGVCAGDFIGCACRGMQEYLQDYRLWGEEGDGAKGPLFASVASVWAEPEDKQRSPWASVYAVGEARYDDNTILSPVGEDIVVTVDGVKCWLAKVADVTVTLAVEVYCNSPEKRNHLMKWYERALFPCDRTGGLLIELPFYYGARIQVSPMSTRYLDTSDSAQKRNRVARSLLKVSGPSVTPYPAKRVTIAARNTAKDDGW